MASIAERVARVWLAGPWSLEGMRARTLAAIDRERLGLTLERLTLGFWRAFRDAPHERRLAPIVRGLEADRRFCAIEGYLWIAHDFEQRAVMAPSPGEWDVPSLVRVEEVCRWLDVDAVELEWLQDPRGIGRHYRRHVCGRRLIEAPRARLRLVQSRVLREVLDHVPAHDAAHGFVRGRSVLSAVRPHAGREVVFACDLRQFFPSVRAARVHAMFQRVGYPEDIARVLTRLTTVVTRTVPPGRDGSELLDACYRTRHLPQGAPTSPALANLCAFRLDARLTGLAQGRGVRYTRYADDLVFSGTTRVDWNRFQHAVTAIAESEGFRMHTEKSRAMHASQRQHVLGLVINEAPRLPRRELEALEAEVCRAVRLGPEALAESVQARRDHLTGRVAWARFVGGPRVERIVRFFEAIDWER